MELLVTSVGALQKSKYGGEFRYIFFKDRQTGEAYETCIDDKCRNSAQWGKVIDAYGSTKPFYLVNCVTKKPGLIDADSKVVVMYEG